MIGSSERRALGARAIVKIGMITEISSVGASA